MILELTVPSSLLFGLARLRSNELAWLGLTLQHPPLGLTARPAAVLSANGARADLAYAQGARVMERLGVPAAEMEIEYAIPKYQGLGSDPMQGLAVALGLARLANHPAAEDTLALAEAAGLDERDALAVHSFEHGGLLLVPAGRAEPAERWPAPLRRFELAHRDDEGAWAWVLHWPHTPPGTPATLEADRAAQLLAAAPHLSEETGRLLEDDLWPALERDDMITFGQALMAIQMFNRVALEQAGTPPVGAPDSEGVLRVLRENDALVWGESATGLARFGLIRGGPASLGLRRQVVGYVGYEGGNVMAAIANNRGAEASVQTDNG